LNTIHLHNNLISWLSFLLSLVNSISHVPLAVITWRYRTHPVVSALFYYAVFICASTVPMKILRMLDWYCQSPTVYKAYFLLYWIFEPISDLLVFFIGYRLFFYLCDSAGLRRFTFLLSRVIVLTVVVSLVLLLSGGAFASHRALWWSVILTAKGSVLAALCALVLVLIMLKNSLGLAGGDALMRVALGLGIVAGLSLISWALTVFGPRFTTMGHYALLGDLEVLGVMIGAIFWCFAAHTLEAEERVSADKKPSMTGSPEQLYDAASLLAEIITR
jgi:hypothetical protein